MEVWKLITHWWRGCPLFGLHRKHWSDPYLTCKRCGERIRWNRDE